MAKERLEFIIAGGNKALLNAVENAEDDTNYAKKLYQKINWQKKMLLLGLLQVVTLLLHVKYWKKQKKNALTIAISNNPKGKF